MHITLKLSHSVSPTSQGQLCLFGEILRMIRILNNCYCCICENSIIGICAKKGLHRDG